MPYGFLADLLAVFHIAYASFICVGFVLILVGIARGWAWVRNPWFRLVHMLAILVVALEAIWDIACPLTTWEAQLRAAAGQEFSGETFIARMINKVLFLQVEPWLLNLLHIAIGLVILATFVLAPPRWRRRKLATDAPR